MLVLRTAAASPFGRKVRLAAALAGLSDRLRVEPADTNDPADSLRAQNPLGKIPVLVEEDGTATYDSRVIVEALDHMGGGGHVLPQDPAARIAARRLEALADGICDAAVLVIYEGRWRPEGMRSETWLAHQRAKVDRALAVLEADPPALDPIMVGEIAVAAALGYLDLRHGGAWRAEHPRLVAWLDAFASKVPAFEDTRPAG